MRSKSILVVVMIVLFGAGYASGTWTTLNMPGASYTEIRGIDGTNLVGIYADARDYEHGFLYDLTSETWATIDKPGAQRTMILGIDGSNLVGSYRDVSFGAHGFLYDGTTWTTLNMPGASYTQIRGIDGTNLVGLYWGPSEPRGFLYDGTTWTTLNMPGASRTYIHGIDGSNLVGEYTGSTGNNHGFVYNLTSETWTIYDSWWAIYGIDGSNLVGRGFLYDMTSETLTSLNMPGAVGETYIIDIDGINLVGYYKPGASLPHGFIYTIPEPCSLVLLALGVLMLRRKR